MFKKEYILSIVNKKTRKHSKKFPSVQMTLRKTEINM